MVCMYFGLQLPWLSTVVLADSNISLLQELRFTQCGLDSYPFKEDNLSQLEERTTVGIIQSRCDTKKDCHESLTGPYILSNMFHGHN